MNVPDKIQSCLKALNSAPNLLDVDFLKETLSEANSCIHAGLKQSKELEFHEGVKANLSDANETIGSLSAEIKILQGISSELKQEKEIQDSLLVLFRKQTAGRTKLVFQSSALLPKILLDLQEINTLAGLVEFRKDIDRKFEATYSQESSNDKPARAGEILDMSKFKTGA